MSEEARSADSEIPQSRLQLLWDVLIFQLKLTVDGIRDVILVPISLFSALVGLIIGGKKPNKYYQRVLKFGRSTERWINLFGHDRYEGTSDDLIRPLQARVFEEASKRPMLRKAGTFLNKSIDSFGDAINQQDKDKHGKNQTKE